MFKRSRSYFYICKCLGFTDMALPLQYYKLPQWSRIKVTTFRLLISLPQSRPIMLIIRSNDVVVCDMPIWILHCFLVNQLKSTQKASANIQAGFLTPHFWGLQLLNPFTIRMVIYFQEEFKAILKDEKNKDKLIVIDFTASWCGPCKVIGPKFEVKPLQT